ncbi:hypothetical protein RU97_GL001897 [Enterococcus canis]|uniref:Sugar isomerase n=1 Tax=Enterococcus canis TaxID=214095 RepID=A0A1L8RFE3_9ENTE|nr:MurR/RpiR family transcriptional regulator [Enterococcus canis]OJG18500.1 hypothetical protein RU97_GL001897 [Enterococcus canis]
MLISEKFQQTDFSTAEQNVVTYIQEHRETLADATVKELADACFVHPSTLIRVAKKMGFEGWLDLKNAYLEEASYLDSHFTEIDPNIPFQPTDGLITIAKKIANLEQTTIADTLELLKYDDLKQAKNYLLKADFVKIFASNANSLIPQDFALKMNRIQQNVSVSTVLGEGFYEAYNCPPTSCGILISYTGENTHILRTAKILKERGIPVIAITSIGENSLAAISDCTLRITTRERLFSKIGNFTINTSICYLLDILYCAVFSEHYGENFDHLIEVGQIIDRRRTSSDIMREPLLDTIQPDWLPN